MRDSTRRGNSSSGSGNQQTRPRGTCPYQQTVFFGKIQTTIQYARATYTRNSATITVLKPGEDDSRDDGGDGTVPSFASFPIELDVSSGGIPLLDKHAAMPAREAALENLVNELNPMDISGLKAVDSTAPDLEGHISVLDVPSEARAGDAVPVQVVSSKSEVVIQLVDHVRGTVSEHHDRATLRGRSQGRHPQRLRCRTAGTGHLHDRGQNPGAGGFGSLVHLGR